MVKKLFSALDVESARFCGRSLSVVIEGCLAALVGNLFVALLRTANSIVLVV